MPFHPIREDEPVHIHRQNLPHWRQWGATYFVTARLRDSLPALALENWRLKRDAWLRSRGLSSASELTDLSESLRKEYDREFTAAFHALLDAGHGACVLSKEAVAKILIAKMTAGHGVDYHLDVWVIMPNHWHALLQPTPGRELGRILRSWKGASAREINRKLGREGPLWQAESFDHIVRSESHRDHFRSYIASNPGKARLKDGFCLGVGAESGLNVTQVFERLSRES
jgi:REP element-mobilizing transposase RayT